MNEPVIDFDPRNLIVPNRDITGMSAILLPFLEDGQIDWVGFDDHVIRTFECGLVPAVNMDTGYANLISQEQRVEVLNRTQALAAGREYVAGAFVGDPPESSFDLDAYKMQIESIVNFGGTPILFQSFGLTTLPDEQIVSSYQQFGSFCDRFLAFELGQVFAPFGKIYSLDVFEQLLEIPQCVGAKHSSLKRVPEWQRLEIRNRKRPDFKVLTGNDLAIDMVIYGSDYLLGLSTFAPDWFAKRDQMWASGDSNFFELNDVLQYLGFFAFRDPVPAYKHSAAMFLKMRDWIATDRTHELASQRPNSDKPIFEKILEQLEMIE